jgi:hypothetical protein
VPGATHRVRLPEDTDMIIQMHRTWLRGLALIVALVLAPAVMAGPPLLCHPFDTAGAPSLPWGGGGWRDARAGYDLRGLARDTEALLTARTPVIARMETLRRAAIYASRDPAVARQLLARLQARNKLASSADARALARFDAGYFAETLQEVVRLQGHDMPGLGRVDVAALRAVLANVNGSAEVDAALALRPNDAAMRFAAALIAAADRRQADYAMHARIARVGAHRDRLLGLNLDQIAN